MNKKADELNLTHTHFVTPHGLDDDEHYTTAYELAILTDYALKNEQFRKIVATKTATIHVNDYPKTIHSTNELLGNLDGVYGVKTGFTFKAGRCLVTSCKRNDMDIIVVVLGADTKNYRTSDSIKIINYIFDNFEYVNIEDYINQSFEEYKKYYQNNVILYKTSTLPDIKLARLKNYDFPLKTNTSNTLKTKFYTINTLSSDINSNDKIGCLNLYYNDKILTSVDIILANNLDQNSWKYYFIKIIKNFNESFYY